MLRRFFVFSEQDSVDQISFLLFIKRLDDLHTAREKQANRLGKPIKAPIFAAGQDHIAG